MLLIELSYPTPVDMAAIEKYTVEHRAWLDKQYEKGLLLCSGPKVPRTGGVIIAFGNDKTKFEELMKEDPFYIHQLAKYTITEFNAVKHHTVIKDLVV